MCLKTKRFGLGGATAEVVAGVPGDVGIGYVGVPWVGIVGAAAADVGRDTLKMSFLAGGLAAGGGAEDHK